MSKKVIKTENAPKAVGPYSQGIRVGNLVFTAGQVGIDPKTGERPEEIEEQTKQALKNVKAILEEAGTSMNNVLKVTVFLKNMDDFGKMNEIYATFFGENPPARSCVEVARLPLDFKVEIEAIAYVED